MKFSGQTAGAIGAKAHCNLMRWGNQGTMPTKLGVVPQTSVTARKLKTRYTTRGGARFVLFMRRILSDRAFDVLLRLTEYLWCEISKVGDKRGPHLSFYLSINIPRAGGWGV